MALTPHTHHTTIILSICAARIYHAVTPPPIRTTHIHHTVTLLSICAIRHSPHSFSPHLSSRHGRFYSHQKQALPPSCSGDDQRYKTEGRDQDKTTPEEDDKRSDYQRASSMSRCPGESGRGTVLQRALGSYPALPHSHVY